MSYHDLPKTLCKCECHQDNVLKYCTDCACRWIPGREHEDILSLLENCQDGIDKCFDRIESLEKLVKEKEY